MADRESAGSQPLRATARIHHPNSVGATRSTIPRHGLRLAISLMALRRAAQDVTDTSARKFLGEGIEHLEQELAELRELARGIHPSHMGEHGLAHAVKLLAARAPLPVEVSVPEERLPQAVETALYFTIAEGLTNVAKYAEAKKARVTVACSAES